LRKRSASELGSASAESHDVTEQGRDNGQNDNKRKTVNDENHAPKSTEIPSNNEERESDDIEEESTSNDDDERESSNEDNESFTTIAMFSDVERYCPGIYEGNREFCCLLKMYDKCDKPLRLNDVIEVVGIYTDDPHYIGCRTKWIPGREPKPKNEEDDEEDLSPEEGEYDDGYEDAYQDLPRDRYLQCSLF
jgi:Mini-chromosome maintenance replisome factor